MGRLEYCPHVVFRLVEKSSKLHIIIHGVTLSPSLTLTRVYEAVHANGTMGF